MTGLPSITLVTPSLNQGRFIEQTIQSVLDQQYPDLEYLIVDGGSADGTVDVLKKYSGRLAWTSEPDRGQSDAINKGLHKARGDVVGFLNSDDLLEPGALQIMGAYFRDHPQMQWVTGRCRIIDAEGREIRRWVSRYKDLWLRLNSYAALQVLNYISQPATFWRRSALAEIGLLDEGLRYSMDYDLWLRMGRRHRLGVIRQTLASFRLHETSKAGSSAAAPFDAEVAIARRYVRSPILMGLHLVHKEITVALYRGLFGHPG